MTPRRPRCLARAARERVGTERTLGPLHEPRVNGSCGKTGPVHRQVLAALVVILALCAGGGAGARAEAVVGRGPCGIRSSPPAAWRHVVWIWLENESYDSVIGSRSAPFLTRLAHACGLATDYSAITHPSLPNYLAAT